MKQTILSLAALPVPPAMADAPTKQKTIFETAIAG